MMATRVLAPPFWPSWSLLRLRGPLCSANAAHCAPPQTCTHRMTPMIHTPITVNRIGGVHNAFTETGGKGQIQNQLITPATHAATRAAAPRTSANSPDTYHVRRL
jgi:hypothetical protein